ncbi:uncharacterized protein LOC144127604 [Amblyomma americanum]
MFPAHVLRLGFASPRLLRSALLAPRQQRHDWRSLHLASQLPRLGAALGGSDPGATLVALRPLHRSAAVVARVSQGTTKRSLEPVPLPYKERQAVVTTCADLYKKWRAEGRHGYRRAPETGAQVPVVYVHTGMDRAERGDRDKRPLALLLTGAPGQYSDYSHNIPHLDQNGADVLCVNWPNFTFSRQTGYWWHSCDEKANLIVDLLKQLGIKKVDMLVAHSTGSPPALQLAAQQPGIQVKSLVLFMPIASRLFQGGKYPLLFNAVTQWVLKARGGATFIMPYFQSVMALSKHPTRGRAYDVYFAYLSSAGYEEAEIEQHIATLRKRALPTLLMFSNNDRLLSVEDNHLLMRRLGHDPQRTWLYDAGGNLVRKGDSGVVKAIELDKGSHYGFIRFADIANEALVELLNSVGR